MYVHADKLKGTLLLVVATSAWGGMFSVAKEAIQWLDPVFVTMVRYTTVAMILMTILFLTEGASAFVLDGHRVKMAVFGVSGMAGFNILALYGLKTASPAIAAMIMVTLPFLSSLVKWWMYGIPMRTHLFWCMVLAMGGVLLVVTKGDVGQFVSGHAGVGELLVFAGAFFWAIYTVGREKFSDWSALRYGALSTTMGAFGLIVIWCLSVLIGVLDIPDVQAVRDVAYQLWYLILIAGVVAIMAWAEGIKRIGAVNASLFMCFVPITAFIVDIVGGYRPEIPEVLGVLVAISALFINHHFLISVPASVDISVP